MSRIESLGRWSSFFLSASWAACLASYKPFLWLRSFQQIFLGALPLAFVAGLALGAVIWIHTRGVLEKTGTGAVEYLPTFLSIAVLLELAPVGAGLIVAARTGAALGAELSSMQVSEQIDALTLIGVSPIRRLVGPRVLACILATPLLHVIIAVLALSSGYVAESFSGQTTWLRYRTALMRELYLQDVVPAGCKTLVFGWLTGITSCYLGLITRGGSEEVGKAATNSVVLCTLTVLAADVVLVGWIRVFQQF